MGYRENEMKQIIPSKEDEIIKIQVITDSGKTRWMNINVNEFYQIKMLLGQWED